MGTPFGVLGYFGNNWPIMAIFILFWLFLCNLATLWYLSYFRISAVMWLFQDISAVLDNWGILGYSGCFLEILTSWVVLCIRPIWVTFVLSSLLWVLSFCYFCPTTVDGADYKITCIFCLWSRSYRRNFYSILIKFCTVVLARKVRSLSLGAQNPTTIMPFRREGPNTAVTRPADRLWRLIAQTTCLRSRYMTKVENVIYITPIFAPFNTKMVINSFLTGIC